jgi:hypothetical protein
MSDTTILVPGEDSVTVTIGETLNIEFVEDCCFCCDPEQVDLFIPQLPLGDHMAGKTWAGVAQETATIEIHHKKYGKKCHEVEAVPLNTGRTITVGDGG